MTDVVITTIHTVLGWPANRAEVMTMLDAIITKAIAVDGLTGEKGIAGYSVLAPHGIAVTSLRPSFFASCHARYA